MTIIRECPICIETIRVNGYVVTECSHYFCLNCFIEHIQSSNKCPMCRDTVIKNKITIEKNIIDVSDEDTPILHYMSDVQSNISSDNETPRFPDISDDESDDSSGIEESSYVERNIRVRAR